MEKRIARFIAGLRASGVRVSVAESEDAWKAIRHMGVMERELFKLSLRSTLIKDANDILIFEELFPLYFGTAAPPLMNPQAELSPQEQQMMQEAADEVAGDLQQLLDYLLNGRAPTQEELEQMAQQTGLDDANSTYQAGRYARRMQRLLNWDRLPEILEMLWEKLREMGMDPQQIAALQQRVQENMEALQGQLEQFAGERIQDNITEEWRDRRQNAYDLMQRPLEHLSETEMDILRDQVRRLAARLRSRVALRQKRSKKGKLDVKNTIRGNLRYGGVPIELKMRTKRKKPKLVVIMDVSRSMHNVTEFFLRLLYELQDQVQKTHSFAFYDHLENVTDDMQNNDIEKAIHIVLTKLPYKPYGTDLGKCLVDFNDDYLGIIDQRTTVIVVGDGRNNFNNPALDTFQDISKRARKTIWLNPEYPRQWGTGDSDMDKYEPLCTEVYVVRNLNDLTNAIDHMLAA
ncbi:MAG: VWA domain-containing protein [Chloroflexi bacterium]|nr:VWA domain-containing protein [Chloroflexota bacterium]